MKRFLCVLVIVSRYLISGTSYMVGSSPITGDAERSLIWGRKKINNFTCVFMFEIQLCNRQHSLPKQPIPAIVPHCLQIKLANSDGRIVRMLEEK